MLGNWIAFTQLFTDIGNNKNLHNDKNSITLAVEQLKTLEEFHFFRTYPLFVKNRSEFCKKYAHILDNVDEHMKNAAKWYFSTIFNEDAECPNVVVDFEEKQVRGVQVSLMKCVFGLNLNLIIKTSIGWLYLCGKDNKHRQNHNE